MSQATGRTPEESAEPDWPARPTAPADAPNVLVVLTDDVGFGASSTFGGPIETPTLDRLADAGLRYTRFHTTAMCSPTRAALLTGRNHHEAGFGRITESAMAYDGYTTVLPAETATLAEVLHRQGFSTALIGKFHNTPDWETGPAGPFDRWPTRLGFDHFYGFQGGGTNNWAPALYRGTEPVEPPVDDPGYHLEADLADEAIRWVRRQKSVAPDRPFFLHYSTAAAHSPHHAPADWIERFRGRFDAGWDDIRVQTLARQRATGMVPADTALTQRPAEIPSWDSLSQDARALYIRQMEVFAASVAYSDAQIGRLLDALTELGELDRSLVVFIQGDNGASAEGGPHGALNEALYMNGIGDTVERMSEHLDTLGGPQHYNHYAVGWAHAMDTPFQWFKQVASHFGGTRNGLVISHPAGIGGAGGVRRQFHHVVDVVPTILDVLGIAAPTTVDGVTQRPMAGTSMRYSFTDAEASSTRRTQYFELHGNRAIYHDGWVAACGPVEMPWAFAMPPPELDDRAWELYHVAQDDSQADDLADQHPDKLRELQDLFWIEAARHQVLPIIVGTARRGGPPQPSTVRGRTEFVYYAGAHRIPPGSAPDLVGRAFTVTAEVDVPADGGQGFLFGQGGRFGGHALYLLGGALVYHYNLLGLERSTVATPTGIGPGRRRLEVRFAPDGEGFGPAGTVTLRVDGREAASTHLERTVPWRMSYIEGLNVARDTGTPVSEDYQVPFAFTGTLHQVRVQLDR